MSDGFLSCCCEILLQTKSLQLLYTVKDRVSESKNIGGAHLPQLQKEYPIEENARQLIESFQQLSNQHSSVYALWLSIFGTYKAQIILSFILVQLEVLCKVALAYILKFLFYSIRDGQNGVKFVYTALVIIVILFQGLLSENGWRLVAVASIQIKASLSYALYQKVINLWDFSWKEQSIGRISSAITELHDILENQSKFILVCLSAPLAVLGLSAFLVWVAGWFALIGVALTIFFEFLHYHYAFYNSTFLDEALLSKSKRMHLLLQIIGAFRYVKMQMWEDLLYRKIKAVRTNERNCYLKYGAGLSIEIALSQGVSTISLLAILGLAVKLASNISSVDVILLVLGIVQIKLIAIFSSQGISFFYQVKVALSKIAQILTIKPQERMVRLQGQPSSQEDRQSSNSSRMDAVVTLRQVSVSDVQNPQPQDYLLTHVSLDICKGQFIGVYGLSGSRKQTLLKLIASYVPYYSGTVSIHGSVAYAEEVPVIFSETIQNNILLGRPMIQQLYSKVIRLSCLEADFAVLPEGDLTVVEEGGVNLSGGQKSRVNLARCLYGNKQIIVLDNPLTSVDLIVAEQLVTNLIELIREGKTVILATNQIYYFRPFQRIFLVNDHEVEQLNEFDKKSLLMHQSEISDPSLLAPYDEKELLRDIVVTENKAEIKLEKEINPMDQVLFDEDSAISWGFWRTFFSYIFVSRWNYLFFTLTALLYVISETLYALFVLLLRQYDAIRSGGTSTVGGSVNFWIALSMISLSIFILQLLRTFFLNLCIQLANKRLLQNGLKKYLSLGALHAEKLKAEYILGRFSNDLGLLDIGLLPELSGYFIVFILVIVQSIVMAIYNPIILAFCAGVIVSVFLWNHYCSTAVNILKKLDLHLKAPLIAQITEVIRGIMQIDLLNASQYITSKYMLKLMSSIRTSFSYRKVFRTYVSYSVYISAIVISGAYFTLAASASSARLSDFTFSAVFLIEINNGLSFIFSNAVKITSILTSAERLQSFNTMTTQERISFPAVNGYELVESYRASSQRNLDQQIQIHVGLNSQMQSHETIAITLQNATMRYNPLGDPALINFSLQIKKGQKIGLIGRTASGKSTIIQLLYRLLEPDPDTVYSIEGNNALTMPLSELRNKFACIPQNPFVFSDTLRNNLDPFGQFSSQQLITALQAVTLWPKFLQLNMELDSDLDPVLSTLSIEEKQLLCLARTILLNREYLILDEATSNLDFDTDELAQRLIREKFGSKTIIAVAHHLQKVADFDRIIVLSRGRVVEAGSPKQLYERRKYFYAMVNASKTTKRMVLEKIAAK